MEMWTRPGRIHVWKQIEFTDSTGKIRKFSLQEIPEDRYDEAVEHMCAYFLKDEVMNKSLRAYEEPASIHLSKKLWNIVVKQGISVAAYEIFDNDERSVLAGLNMLIYIDDETEKVWKKLKEEPPSLIGKVLDFMDKMCAQADPRKIYEIDGYLGALGLSVEPKYRRMGLAQRLLEIRDDIGKAYDIKYTSTTFTSPASQRPAEKVGFHTNLEYDYADALDDDGNLLFPDLKGVKGKIMGKFIF